MQDFSLLLPENSLIFADAAYTNYDFEDLLVALRLIDLRERARIYADAPAKNSGFQEIEIKTLESYFNRKLLTVRDVILAIGRMGGHKNRKGDGMPGQLTLWYGLNKLFNLVEGVKLARKLG